MRPSPSPLFIALLAALAAGTAEAQQTLASGSAAPPTWSWGITPSLYLPPDGDEFLQPTVTADRGPLHLESRYNWEDRESLSFFVGGNLELGSEVRLVLTPMIGGLVGRSEGIVPALNLDLSWGPLELSASPEYVIDLADSSPSYFYVWSELSLWLNEWLRAGVVVQRTRVSQTEREIDPGLLAGASVGNLEGVVYLFNPGRNDQLVVLSLGLGL